MLRLFAEMIPNAQRLMKPLVLFAAFLMLGFSSAVAAQNFVKGYATDDSGLRPGMAVALSASGTADRPLVERAGREDHDKVIGVTTTIEESLVTIASNEHDVYVKSSGSVDAFVSDVNGAVKKGDKVTVSPLKGILMRGDPEGAAIGVANEDFADAPQPEPRTIIADSGEINVLVAKMAVTLDNNLGRATAEGGTKEPTSLQRLGKTVVGKEVGELQVIIALIIFFVMMIAEGGIVYGAVSSSITSLGRNPLAKTIIVRELVRVLGVVIVVLLVGLAAIYAVLLI